MLFGAMKILAEELMDVKPVEVERYGYGEWPTDIRDMLHSPMTLSQGARIINEYRLRIENGSPNG